MHISYFSIFYSTTFTILTLLLIVLLLITPGDSIYQSVHSDRLGQVLSLAGVYVLTLIVALLIYSTRLYTSKSHLNSIPKSWIPIRKGDVSKSVRRMILESLHRSATIAYDAHPRDLRQDRRPPSTDDSTSRPTTADRPLTPPTTPPIWGTIAHPGWSSPSSPDLPNLHYLPVILELPHLIEAKAVSLAPPDPFYNPPSDPLFNSAPTLSPSTPAPPQPIPDALAVSLLQRPAPMTLRDYISHLTTLSLIQPPPLGPLFLAHYERARFSDIPLSEPDFRTLMSIFASILRGMTSLSPAIIAELHSRDENAYASDSQSEHESDTTETGTSVDARSISTTDTVEHTTFHTPMPYSAGFNSRRQSSEDSVAGSEGTVRTAPSRARRTTDASRNASRGTKTREGSSRGGSGRSKPPGSKRVRAQTMEALRMTPSAASRKSSRSSVGSGGSVIRLAERGGPLDLPYVITTEGMEDEGEEEI